MGRLRARTGLLYPAPESLAAVLEARGLSQMTPQEREAVKFRRVAPGEWCDDVPEISRERLLAKGQIEEVEDLDHRSFVARPEFAVRVQDEESE